MIKAWVFNFLRTHRSLLLQILFGGPLYKNMWNLFLTETKVKIFLIFNLICVLNCVVSEVNLKTLHLSLLKTKKSHHFDF